MATAKGRIDTDVYNQGKHNQGNDSSRRDAFLRHADGAGARQPQFGHQPYSSKCQPERAAKLDPGAAMAANTAQDKLVGCYFAGP